MFCIIIRKITFIMHQAANMNDVLLYTTFDRPRLLNRKWRIRLEEFHAAVPDVFISRIRSILSMDSSAAAGIIGEIVKRFNWLVANCRRPWKRNRNLHPTLFPLANRCLITHHFATAADAVLRCSTDCCIA